MSQNNKLNTLVQSKLNAEEKERILDIFNDPIKILIILKIIKRPSITSKELKDEINIPGTKIYYYIDDLEGYERNPPKDSDNRKIKTKIEVVVSSEEKTYNHLTQKKYKISSWLQQVLEKSIYLNLFDNEEENLKWNYLFGLNISIALMTQHKREIELTDSQEFKPNSKLQETIQYNNLMFVNKEEFDQIKPNFKQMYEEVCKFQNNNSSSPMSNLLSAIYLSSHAFVLGAMSW